MAERIPTAMKERLRKLLKNWNEGDEKALEEIVPIVNRELKRRAVNRLWNEPSDITWEPSDLVQETFLRLAKRDGKPRRPDN